MYIVLAKYIQNQNIVMPNVVIGLIVNGVNALLHYILLAQHEHRVRKHLSCVQTERKRMRKRFSFF